MLMVKLVAYNSGEPKQACFEQEAYNKLAPNNIIIGSVRFIG